jgi:hypothetical protein
MHSNAHEGSGAAPTNAKALKKPYATPRLIDYGDVTEITGQGGEKNPDSSISSVFSGSN